MGGSVSSADPVGTLAALEATLAQDFDRLCFPPAAWTPDLTHPESGPVLDVAIVGAGMLGLTAGASLRRVGLQRIRLFDRAPLGLEGPWETYARMVTLRSPKILTGPALGLANLTFRAWFEAQFGADAWATLGKIPRGQWMAYLRWYRRVLGLEVASETAITEIVPDGNLFRLRARGPSEDITVHARKVVLATGRDGLGGPHMPAFASTLPRRLWAHSADAIDFATLRDRRVAVIGIGASAVDNAGEALEAGAARVDLFVRRPDIPRINKLTGIGSPGLVLGYHRLPDVWKWRFMRYAERSQVPPPRESVLRVSRHAAAAIHLACPVESARAIDGGIRLETARGPWEGDFLILGTGFEVDLARRPELAALAPHVALWRDRFTPPAEEQHDGLLAYPWVGAGFELTERVAGECPILRHLHCFNYAAMMSQGKNSGDIPAVSDGATRLAEAIASDLFVADAAYQFERLLAFDTAELRGDEWVDAPLAPVVAEAAE